jgi:hypothetical protein
MGRTASSFVDANACARCGLQADSSYFDESSIVPLPGIGREVVLAEFALPPQYCGVVEYFAQFTNLLAVNPGAIETAGLDWALLSDGRPLAPYLRFDRILNPWGYGSFQVALRLEESVTVQFVARNRSYAAVPAEPAIERIGGRIVGRYWYDASYGDVRGSRRN